MVREKQPFHLTPYPQPVGEQVIVRARPSRSPPPPLVTWNEYTQRVVGNQPMYVEMNYTRPTETVRKAQSQPASPNVPRRSRPIMPTTTEVPIGVAQCWCPAPVTQTTPLVSRSPEQIRKRESDGQFCQACNRMVDPSNKFVMMDRVYHPECARCQTCKIDLERASGREFGGILYCMPHYAQAVADYMEYRRKNSSSLTRATPTEDGSLSRRGSYRLSGRRPSKNAWSVYDMQLQLPADEDTFSPDRVSVQHVDTVSAAPPYSVEHDITYIPVERQSRMDMQQVRSQSYVGNAISAAHPLSVEQETTYIPVERQSRTDMQEPTSQTYVNHPSQALGGCAVCGKSVFPTNYVPLSGRLYHFYCLQCHMCGRNLSPWVYRELDGRPYCSKDYQTALNEQQAMKTAELSRSVSKSELPYVELKLPVDKTTCYACGQKSFATETLYVMERVYHKRCFKCTACNGTLGVENYYVLDGQPYCRAHYRALLFARGIENIRASLQEHAMEMADQDEQGSIICQTCHNPVRPRDCINVLQQYYHYNCFKCEKCGQLLNIGKFEMMQGKPYCPEDFLALFGRPMGRSSRQSLTNVSELVRERSLERQRSMQGRMKPASSTTYVR